MLQQQILVKEMKQVIKKTIKEAKNINDEPLIYTLLVDGNNLMKISSVDKRMNGKSEEYGIVFQFLWQLHKLLQVKDRASDRIFRDLPRT